MFALITPEEAAEVHDNLIRIEDLKNTISMLKKYVSSFEDVYNTIKENGSYDDFPKEDIKRLYDKV